MLLLNHEADMARQWILELRNRAIRADGAASKLDDQPIETLGIPAVLFDLQEALRHLEGFEARIATHQRERVRQRQRTRQRTQQRSVRRTG